MYFICACIKVWITVLFATSGQPDIPCFIIICSTETEVIPTPCLYMYNPVKFLVHLCPYSLIGWWILSGAYSYHFKLCNALGSAWALGLSTDEKIIYYCYRHFITSTIHHKAAAVLHLRTYLFRCSYHKYTLKHSWTINKH